MKDCTFDNGNKCKALVDKQCEGCLFCKTAEELNAGRKKAEERIKSLPKETQFYIQQKYYGRSNPTK